MSKKSKRSKRVKKSVKVVGVKTLIDCMVCFNGYERKALYSHGGKCDTLVCALCIFRNVFIHLRKKCPFCRIDYTSNQMIVLTQVYKKEFEYTDLIAMGEIVKSCDTAGALFDICIEQTNLMIDYKNIAGGITNLMSSLNNFILRLPFPFILGITKSMNIMIMHYKYFDCIKNCAIDGQFSTCLNVKAFALYTDEISNGCEIPLLSFSDIKKIVECKPIYKTRVLTCQVKKIKDKLEELEDVSIEITKQRCVLQAGKPYLEEQTIYRIITIDGEESIISDI